MNNSLNKDYGFIENLVKGSISSEDRDILTELGVIDFHSHIGNILEKKPAQIYSINDYFPVDIRTLGGRLGFKTPGKMMKKIIETDFFDNILKQSGKNRNSSANLMTFAKSLDEAYISKAVCLPIPPYQTFDDLLKAQKADDRIIAFTGVDFTKEIDLSNLEKQFERDILAGAKGLKIHPIIQSVNPSSDKISDIVDLWSKYDLPIIFHTGVTQYCTKDENCNHHTPEYGQIKYFLKLAKNHKKAKIVIGHSGLFQVDEVIEYLTNYDNILVDTSFQSKEKILKLLNFFGDDRALFASDWPYGDRIPAVNTMLEALDDDYSLIQKVFRDNALNTMNMKK